MTSIRINVKDDCKVDDVVRFLRDIDFLDVIVGKKRSKASRKQSVNQGSGSKKKVCRQRFQTFSQLAVSSNDFVMPDREKRNAR